MVFKALVDAIIKHKREPDDVFALNTINTLKRELQHDLTQAFDSSKYLIEKNPTLFWESKSFLDFLLKLNDLPTDEFRPTINRDSLRQELDDYQNKLQRLQNESDNIKRNLENDLKDCQQENKRLTNDLQDWQRYLNDSKINVNNLKDQLKTAMEKDTKQTEQLKWAMEQYDILKAKYSTLETNLNISETNNKNMTEMYQIEDVTHDADNGMTRTRHLRQKITAPKHGLFIPVRNGGALAYATNYTDSEMSDPTEEDLKVEIAQKQSELGKCQKDLETTKSEHEKTKSLHDELKKSHTQVDAKVTELERKLNIANALIEKQTKELSFLDRFSIKEASHWETIISKYEDNEKILKVAREQLRILNDERDYVNLTLENFAESSIEMIKDLPHQAPKLDKIAREAGIENDKEVVESFRKYIGEYNDYKNKLTAIKALALSINPKSESDTDWFSKFLEYAKENHAMMVSLREQVTTFNEKMGNASDWFERFIVWINDRNKQSQLEASRLEEIAKEAGVVNNKNVVENFKKYIKKYDDYKKEFFKLGFDTIDKALNSWTDLKDLAVALNSNWKHSKLWFTEFMAYVEENHNAIHLLRTQVSTFNEEMAQSSDWLKRFIVWFKDQDKQSPLEDPSTKNALPGNKYALELLTRLEQIAQEAGLDNDDDIVENFKEYIKKYKDYKIQFFQLGFDTIDKALKSWTNLKDLAVALNSNWKDSELWFAEFMAYAEKNHTTINSLRTQVSTFSEKIAESNDWVEQFIIWIRTQNQHFENAVKIIKELSELTPDILSANKHDWKDMFIKRYEILTSFANFFMDEKKIDYSDDQNLETKVFHEPTKGLGEFLETLKTQASHLMPEIVQESNWVKLYVEKLSAFVVELYHKNVGLQIILPFDQWTDQFLNKKDFELRKSKLTNFLKTTRATPYSTRKNSSEDTEKESSLDLKLTTLETVENYFNLKSDKLDKVVDHIRSIFQSLLLNLKTEIPKNLEPQEYENAKFEGHQSPFVQNVSFLYLVLKYTIDKQISINENNLKQIEKFKEYNRELHNALDLKEEIPMEQFVKKLKENLSKKIRKVKKDLSSKRKNVEAETPEDKRGKMQRNYTDIEIQNLFSSIYKAYFTLKLNTMKDQTQNKPQIEDQQLERVERKLTFLDGLNVTQRESDIFKHLIDYVYYDLETILGKTSPTFGELTLEMHKMLYRIINHTENYLSALVKGEELPEPMLLQELERVEDEYLEDEHV